MNYKELIEEYQLALQEYDLSPFEAVEALHIRTQLHNEYEQLSVLEKALLVIADLDVLKNKIAITNHLKKAYDFRKSTEPVEQWWWHLERISKDELKVAITFNVQTTIEEVT